MFACCSGKHHWSERSDADRCCNPAFVRALAVAAHQPGFVPVYTYYWLRVEQRSAEPVTDTR